jgi:hypothetical protein
MSLEGSKRSGMLNRTDDLFLSEIAVRERRVLEGSSFAPSDVF